MVDFLAEYVHLLSARTQIFSDQRLQVEQVNNLEQEEHDKQFG